MKCYHYFTPTLAFLFLSTCFAVLAADKPPGTSVKRYHSPLQEGSIGVSDLTPFDNPSDNIFHVSIPESLQKDNVVWLVYELEGVEDHTCVSRSINDQLSIGGYIVRKREGWVIQRERIHASWLKKGDNVIRFTTTQDARHNYRVRNLRIEAGQSALQATEKVVFNQPVSAWYYNDQVYIKGFVTDNTILKMQGKDIPTFHGEFEAVVERSSANECELEFELIHPDGRTTCHAFTLSESLTPDFVYAMERGTQRIEKFVDSGKPAEINLRNASLFMLSGSLTTSTTLSITSLRSVDIPALDAGLINVTHHHSGYRFLPHGTVFRKEAEIRIPFDATKLPEGYTHNDIRTYYFDEQSHHWIALTVDTVLVESGEVVSRTTHFTDFINGVIQVPESPETEAYNPTTMKNIRSANPGDGINLIDIPESGSMGNASLGYGIELPAGRGGVQPNLRIGYNNEGGNGWMGLGWNLDLPSISIDTRWGVPRYDITRETETYLIEGQQLSPVAHRGTLADRTAEKQFYLRVEGSFDRIIRHGDSPSSYWWEVTDKMGTRYFYGATPAGVDESAVLRDNEAADAGNIAHWYLREVRDLKGNTIRYHYAKVEDIGVTGGSVPGHQIYPEHISYTGYMGSEGAYTVHFIRDRQLSGWTRRPDVSISGTLGFKRVTADLLRKIEVRFNGQPVRSYALEYTTGEFYKTLLARIKQFDAAGNFFNEHTLDYYNDVRTANTFTPLETSGAMWTPHDDDIRENFVISNDDFSDKASLLSGNRSTDVSVGLSVTVAAGFQNLACKTFSVGGNYSRVQGASEGLLSLIDINGDGLSDKVVLKGGDVQYRANLGTGSFSDILFPVTGISDLYREKNKTNNVGFEANLGQCKSIGVVLNKGLSLSTSTTTAYFADVNGDQLVDFVKNGGVRFGTVDTTTGEVNFTPNSDDTPSRIFAGAAPTDAVTQTPAELAEAEEQHPLHDVVRMWRAPFTGTVNVVAPVNLVEDTSPERAETPADGVRVAIQLRAGELWSQVIGATDYSVHHPSGITGLFVNKGDRLFFRVGSVYNGSYDQVNWAPVVTYTSLDPALSDANGNSLYRFDAERDYVLASPQIATAPVSGTLRVSGNFVKPQTTDNVHLVVLKRSGALVDTVLQQRFEWNQTANIEFAQANINVTEHDEFIFKVISSTTIDWPLIQWQPRLTYTSTTDPGVDLATTPIEAFPIPEYSVLPNIVKASRGWKVNFTLDTLQRDTLTFAPVLNIIDPFPILPLVEDDITFSIKKRDTLVAKRTLHVENGRLTDMDTTLTVVANKGDSLYIEFHVPNLAIASAVNFFAIAEGTYIFTSFVNPGVYTSIPPGADHHDQIFGPLYRGWGHFAWRANGAMATTPVDELLLKLSEDLTDPADPGGFDDPGDLTNPDVYDQTQDQFIMLTALGRQQRWQGYDDLTFVIADGISSSRLGEDDLSAPSGSGSGSVGINKISKSRTDSFSAGLSGGAQTFNASGNYSWSDGNSTVVTDYIDMNGDRYPDIITRDLIQYTNARGGLEATTVSHSEGNIQNSITHSEGVSVAGSAILSDAEPSNLNIKRVKMSVGNGQNSAGLNGSYAWGENRSSISWLDINGDGLPDRISGGADKKVALNLGYRFAPEESWNFINMQAGKSNSKSAGLGVAFGNGSVNLGVGVSQSENFATYALIDVNGDGLADQASHPDEDGNVLVKINAGNQFMNDELTWAGAVNINENSSTSESANIGFTIGIPIPPIFTAVTLYINPSASIGHGMNRELSKFVDLDGDGYLDFAHSSADDDLTVYRSKIGRTNMLKNVHRPMGAEFTLNYKLTGGTYAQPNNMWVLDSLHITDGFAGDGVDVMLKTFDYRDGNYDRHEREFYGFETVIARIHDTGAGGNPVYTEIIKTFNNDNFYEKGLLLSEVLKDGNGNRFTETLNTWQLNDIHTGAVLPESAKTDDAGTAFPALTETTNNFYEGQATPGKATHMQYTYDAKGNVATYTDFGDNGTDDDFTTTTTYHSIAATNIFAIPSSSIVVASGGTLRKSETSIDAATGNITQIRKYLDASIAAVYDMQYDEFGNLIRMTRPENHDGQRLSMDYIFEDDVHTYITQVTNSYGYQSETTYDLRFGQALTRKDINTNEIRTTLDNAGRISTITGPYEIANGEDYTIKFEYHPDAVVPWALTRSFDPANPGNDFLTSIFTDGLNRVIQSKKDGALFAGDGTADTQVMLVSGRILFDGVGRTTHSYYPVTEPPGTTGVFNDDNDSENPTVTSYDVLNRITSLKAPDMSTQVSVYGFENDRYGVNQFSRKMTDPNGKQSETFSDVRGRITSEKKVTSAGDVWVSFRYSAINEPIEATDDLGHATLSTHDNFGRRTQRIHPDAGTTNYTYDLAGNLIEMETANLHTQGLAIEYQYDFERPKEILYPSHPENNVKYSYGEDGAPHNRAGRIVLQEDATGAQEFFYGPMGEQTKNIRTIVIPQHTEQTLVTEWEYDTWNRLVSMTYADKEKVEYVYNAGGRLRSMTGKKKNATYAYVNQLGYDKFEQRTFLAYGNGTKTTYSYEPDRRRLQNVVARTTASRVFMNNHYGYDHTNNVLSFANQAPVPHGNLMGGPTEYHYAYDDLYRLTDADGFFQGAHEKHRYTLAMEYNSVGGIVSKNQVHEKGGNVFHTVGKTTYDQNYGYGTDQPHAPVHIGAQTYTYDDNGNQTGWTHDVSGQRRRILWDEEDRMRAVYDNGALTHYTYDASGQRVLKGQGTGNWIFVNGQLSGGNGQMGNYTVYVNPYIVLHSGGYTKHYFIENERIVSKLGGGFDNNGMGPLKAGGNNVNFSAKHQQAVAGLSKNLQQLGTGGQTVSTAKSNKPAPGHVTGDGNTTEAFRYFFHPDHLGSTSYVTDASGEVYQHLEYFAFGETFVEEHSNTHRTPYLFNGKELDSETGLYYYGARYYESVNSVWQSIDPSAENYPGWSPYNYVMNNPVKMVDPDGKDVTNAIKKKRREVLDEDDFWVQHFFPPHPADQAFQDLRDINEGNRILQEAENNKNIAVYTAFVNNLGQTTNGFTQEATAGGYYSQIVTDPVTGRSSIQMEPGKEDFITNVFAGMDVTDDVKNNRRVYLILIDQTVERYGRAEALAHEIDAHVNLEHRMELLFAATNWLGLSSAGVEHGVYGNTLSTSYWVDNRVTPKKIWMWGGDAIPGSIADAVRKELKELAEKRENEQ
jgi:RHS repeat-associated protein